MNREQPAQLTVEDFDIWVAIGTRFAPGRWVNLWDRAQAGDRHDADLMFCWLAAPVNSPRYWSLYYLSGRHLG